MAEFDEAYYEAGDERGTQYRNYLESAPKNRFYFEIAEKINSLFAPKRTLEIGCAVGIIVSHLATFDVEAHGIDVSDWAVANRFDERVVLGSVAELPYDDDYFDVVYSVHALEHVPRDLARRAFEEMSRVCKGFQLHLMPMLESGPYVGDRFAHLLNLRTDPTHNLLYDRSWWAEQFAASGWHDTHAQVALVHDNEYFEFSACQMLASREGLSAELLARIAKSNFEVAQLLSLALNGKPAQGLEVHIARLRS